MQQNLTKVTLSALAALGSFLVCIPADGENYYYVAPAARGNGSGSSASNAAHYRNSTLWQNVQSSLQSEPTTVRFVDGVYSDDTLNLTQVGNANNRLMLTSVTGGAVFDSDYSWNIRLRGSRNIIFDNLQFTGSVNSFALHMQHNNSTPTRDITVRDCRFVDLPDAQYGAIGITFQTHDITIQDNVFQRVGKGGGAHMIYTDHGPYNIYVYNNIFEDDPGDYVRFRDDVGYFEVIGNTFRSTKSTLSLQRPFLSMPLYNDVNPGDEIFATEMLVRDNFFEYHSVPDTDPYRQWYGQAISFANFGYNYPGLTYQLSPAQAEALQSGSELTIPERISLLHELTGIDLGKVTIENNQYTNVPTEVAYGSWNQYGAPSSGWIGFIDIADLVTPTTVHDPSADFNRDGFIDSADLALWASAYGTSDGGDADGDGQTSGRDFLIWQRQFGSSSPATATQLSIPEPTASTLLGPTMMMALLARPIRVTWTRISGVLCCDQ